MKKLLVIGVTFFVFTAWARNGEALQGPAHFAEVKIGSQIWMAENLDVMTFRNGDTIPQARSEREWGRAANRRQAAWCYYSNDSVNGAKYGRLYNFYAVNDPRGLAPAGWHIPTAAEWLQLTDFLGGMKQAGIKLKSSGGWSDKGSGINSSGFSGLPGGSRGTELLGNKNGFRGFGNFGIWWSSTHDRKVDIFVLILSDRKSKALKSFADPGDGLSVRCIKD